MSILESQFLRRAAQAMLDDIGNSDSLDMDDPYRRIITIQLSSADLIGMLMAAIAAMREPTETMLEVGRVICGASYEGRFRLSTHDAEMCWRAMIDAALTDKRA